MKIAIYCGNLVGFDALSLEERPLGGTETAAIRLSEELVALKHEVHVFTNLEKPRSKEVKYFPLAEVQSLKETDIFISIRDWIPLFYDLPTKKRFFWTGDSYDQFANYGVGDKRVSNQIDAFLSVSAWQADEISKRSGFPREKCFVLGNGIASSLFESEQDRKRKRLIYSSTPYRGLELVPAYYQALLSKHPDMELHIFSGYDVYNTDNDQFKNLREALQKLPNSTVHGNVTQSKLAEEFMKSSILFYPCIFEETSCITAMEAMAAGCVPLSSALGALPETIGDAGLLVQHMPGTEDYHKDFLLKADQLLSDDSLWENLSKKSKEKAQNYSWQKRAVAFDKFINEHVKISA